MNSTEPAPQAEVMLPADQVAAMIEQLRLEQARLLREQQDAIVAHVMKSLCEQGVIHISPTEVATRAATRPQLSPSKLEQSLHTLVLHSLEESGLTFPHVQRVADPVEPTLRSTRPSLEPSFHRVGNAIVGSRHEVTSPCETRGCDRIEEAPAEPRVCVPSAQPTSRATRTKPMPAQVTMSPFRDPMHGRQERQSIPTKSRRRHRRESPSGADADDMYDGFSSVRSKVGHKTLAILDRSRALLDDLKKGHTGNRDRASPNGESNRFVSRMRQKLSDATSPRDQTLVETDHDSEPRTNHSSRPASPALCTKSVTPESPHQSAESDRLPTADVGDHPPPHPRGPAASPHVSCDDIEILRPPAHSPENGDEWENELARQILTIYATSVKAKRAGAADRPSSRTTNRAGTSPSPTTHHTSNRQPQLGSSCSLPAIHRLKPVARSGHRPNDRPRSRSPPRAAVQYSWEPSQRLRDGRVVVNMPKVPKPIWFAGTGAVKAVWCAIAEGFQGLHASPSKPHARERSGTSGVSAAVCAHQLCEEVRRLEAKQQYSQCITTLETLLVSLVRARGVDTLETKLWRQLVVTCNAFASRCVDYKKFALALQLIQQAERLLHNSILVDDAMRLELLAYLYDTYAHYYYRRGKSHAGLQYMLKAHEIHVRQSSWAHLAKCRLHIANLLSQQGKHQDAMAYMAQILEMIEDRQLEDPDHDDSAGASAQKVCLAAVCYNNLAVEQLHVRAFEAASVSTGNAKRLARLCLSYSNRWLAQFDATSNCVDVAIATVMEDANAAANAAYKP